MSNGSILAQTGANIGSMFAGGMSDLGRSAEGMLTGVGQMINQRQTQKQAQELLAANKDNPAALMEAARKFAMQGNTQYATMFQQAAEAATQSQIQGAVAETLKPGVTPEQMMQTAQQLNSLGRTQEAMALAGKARELMATTQAGQALQRRKEAIAESARKLGMDELAERALETSDEESLRAIQKDLRDYERREVIKTRGIPGRKALAKNTGLEYEPYMSDLSDDNFAKLLDGADAQLKTFIAPDGTEQMLEVNKQGRVMDPESGKFVRASELGLRPAPNRQQVENIANFKSEKLIEAGVKRYDELATAANDASSMINNITEVMPNVDDMITGKLANAELFVRGSKQAIAAAVGLNPDDPRLENTQTFVAMAAPRVATIIKDFGAGTGLSDADREFATLASGGDITMTANALKTILKILKSDAERTIKLFDDVTEEIRQDKGQDPLVFYRIPAVKTGPTVTQPVGTTQDVSGLPTLPPGATLD